MKQLTMKLKDLVRPERNIRIHTEKQLEEFERSVRMFGQIRPIVVDENNVILAGNGLYETLLRMNKEDALVYKYEDLTEAQKKKLMIADNKIFSLGIENLDTLNEFLEELDGEEVRKIKEANERREQREATENVEEKTADQIPDSHPEFKDGDADAVQTPAETGRFVICPKCGERIWL